MKMRTVPITELIEHPQNARQGDVGAIATSIEANGVYKPLVVQASTRYVLSGNHSLKAMRALGHKRVSIVEVDVDDETARRVLLADNRTSDLATYDNEALAAMLREIATPDPAALLGTGWDGDDLDDLLRDLNSEPRQTGDDGPPPLPTGEPESKLGEVYELGPHRLICGDATDTSHAAELMQGEHASLLFTSPPYGDARDYDKESGVNLDPEHLAAFLGVFAEHADLVAVNLGLLRKDHAVVPYWDAYLERGAESGLTLVSWNVWDRGQPWSIAQNTALFPLEHEWVLVWSSAQKLRKLNLTVKNKTPGARTGVTNRQQDGTLERVGTKIVRERRSLGTVFRSPPHLGPDAGHPAMFPVALPQAYIDAATDRGDAVIDPFAGSGSTMVAAHALDRRCFMAEISPRYCDVIRERWRRIEAPE